MSQMSQSHLVDEDDIKVTSSKHITYKHNEDLDNNKKLVIDLYGISKYIFTKNDLQYKVFFLFF